MSMAGGIPERWGAAGWPRAGPVGVGPGPAHMSLITSSTHGNSSRFLMCPVGGHSARQTAVPVSVRSRLGCLRPGPSSSASSSPPPPLRSSHFLPPWS